MSNQRQLRIEFDNALPAFTAGSTITGNVLLVLDEATKLRSIYLRVHGAAVAEWRQSQYEICSSERVYIDRKIVLWSAASDDSSSLPAGAQRFPFKFDLPADCSHSFETEHGHIAYIVEAVLDRGSRLQLKQTAAEPIKVIRPVDLNRIAAAPRPVQKGGLKPVSFWMGCTSGELELLVCLPRSGYILGDSFTLTAHVTNNSTKQVQAIVGEIRQHSIFSAVSNLANLGVVLKEFETRSIDKVRKECNEWAPMERGTTVTHHLRLRLSTTVPPTLTAAECNVIQIGYEVNVRLVMGGFSSGLDVGVPIIVGTIPVDPCATAHIEELPKAYFENITCALTTAKKQKPKAKNRRSNVKKREP